MQKKNMRPHPNLGSVKHRPDLEINGPETAEGPLNATQPFVGRDRSGTVEGLGGQAGADHIKTVKARFAGDRFGVALTVKDARFIHPPSEVFFDLEPVYRLASPDTNSRLPFHAKGQCHCFNL